MNQYLLSTYAMDEEPSAEPPSPEAMTAMMERIIAIEADMDATGSFVFGGHLHGPAAATVVRTRGAELIMTDGPFIESKEHISGFYIINAEDLDAALAWAGRVADCIGRPIEVQPFAATGRVADQLPG